VPRVPFFSRQVTFAPPPTFSGVLRFFDFRVPCVSRSSFSVVSFEVKLPSPFSPEPMRRPMFLLAPCPPFMRQSRIFGRGDGSFSFFTCGLLSRLFFPLQSTRRGLPGRPSDGNTLWGRFTGRGSAAADTFLFPPRWKGYDRWPPCLLAFPRFFFLPSPGKKTMICRRAGGFPGPRRQLLLSDDSFFFKFISSPRNRSPSPLHSFVRLL